MLFKLKSSQCSLHFLFQQALHHHNHRQHHLLMASMICYHPSSHFSKAKSFSQWSSLSSDHCCLSFSFLQKQPYANVFLVNRTMGFTLQGCFDINGNSNNVFLKPKARAFASFPRPPLLADLEDITAPDYDCDATMNRSPNGNPTKPRSFQDCHLSKKLVVAVDVDEGSYAYAILILPHILGLCILNFAP